MSDEIWRQVPGFSDYEVSSHGRVRTLIKSSRTNPGHILRARRKLHGEYLIVGLTKDGRRYPRTVHRLVMEAFVGALPPNCDRSHLDGDPSNNRLDNLVFEPKSVNNLRKRKHGTAQTGARNANARFHPDDIPKIRLLAAEGMSRRKIARQFGCSHHAICRILSGKTWASVPSHENDGAPRANSSAPQPQEELS